MTCTYQYVVTDTNPPVTYLEDEQGKVTVTPYRLLTRQSRLPGSPP